MVHLGLLLRVVGSAGGRQHHWALGRSFVFNLDVEQGEGKTQEGIELGVFQREDTLHEWQQC